MRDGRRSASASAFGGGATTSANKGWQATSESWCHSTIRATRNSASPRIDESARCARPVITLPWHVPRDPIDCREQAPIEFREVVAETVISGVDHPEPFRLTTQPDQALRVGKRHELVMRRVQHCQRQRRYPANQRRCAERGLVRDAVRQVNERVPPSPPELV